MNRTCLSSPPPTSLCPLIRAIPGKRLFAALLAPTLALIQTASLGQIIADPSAPGTQRPTILQDAAGRPLVNIQTPSAAGVSRNTYRQFDVQADGIVLNNARASNPWLTAGTAKVILNEVNASQPSYLRGPITINGQRAQVVIANPRGIEVDGASFINASRATLTTGTAVLDGGALQRLDVRQGTVTLHRLQAGATDYADIISRAAVIKGRVDANQIAITTGTQSVGYEDGTLIPLPGDGPAPAIAIDTVNLGGMYANSISLRSTEAGVGVRNTGMLQSHASHGQLRITANGRLENRGNMEAAITTLHGVEIIHGVDLNTGRSTQPHDAIAPLKSNEIRADLLSINAEKDVTLALRGRIRGIGGGTAQAVSIRANDAITFSWLNSISTNGALAIQAGKKITASHLQVRGNMGSVTLLAGSGLDLQHATIDGSRVHLETGTPFVHSPADIVLHGGSVQGKEQTTVIASRDLVLTEAEVSSGKPLLMQAGRKLTLRQANVQADSGNLTLIAAGAFEAHASKLFSERELNIAAASIRVQAPASTSSKTEQRSAAWRRAKDTLTAGQSLRLEATQGDLEIGALTTLKSKGAINLSARNTLTLQNMRAYTDVDLIANGKTFIATQTNLQARQLLRLHSTATQTHTDGRYRAGAVLLSGVSTLHNTHLNSDITPSLGELSGAISLQSEGRLTLSADSRAHAAADLSIITGKGDITLTPRPETGSDLMLTPAQIQAGRDLGLVARGGTLKLLTRDPGEVLSLQSQRDLHLAGASVAIQAASLTSKQDLFVTSHQGSILIDGIKQNVSAHVSQKHLSSLRKKLADYNTQISAKQQEHARTLDQILSPEALQTIEDEQSIWLEIGLPIPDPQWNLYHEKETELAATLSPLTVARDHINTVISTLASPSRGSEHLGATLSAQRHLELTSAQGLAAFGAQLQAGGRAALQAAGTLPVGTDTGARRAGLVLAGLSDFYEQGVAREKHHTFVVLDQPTTLTAGGDVLIRTAGRQADARLVLNHAEIVSRSGKVELHSQADMRLEAGQEEFYSQTTETSRRRKWWGKRKVTTTVHTQHALSAAPVTLKGRSIHLKSGASIDAYASRVLAPQGHIQITAANALSLHAVDTIRNNTRDSRTRSSWLGIKTGGGSGTKSRSVSAQLPSRLVAQTIDTASGWDTLLQGTVFDTHLKGARIQAGVGASARADAKIILDGIQETIAVRQVSQRNDVVWQRQSGSGSTRSSLALPQFSKVPVFEAGGGLRVQIPAGAFRSEVSKLSQRPGMGYITRLTQRRDVDWRPVQLAFEQWRYQQAGLTPAGAALLAIAVTAATHGTGAQLLGTTGSVSSAAANAGLASLASQASITLLNHRGDIGKTLRDLAGRDTVRAAVAAAITAGLLEQVGGLDSIRTLKDSAVYTDRLAHSVINANTRALSNAVLTGGTLQDALRAGLIGGVVDSLHGEAASRIKSMELGYVNHKLAHALAGCAAGAAATQSCSDGAIGAAVGEIVAELMPPANGIAYSPSEKNTVLAASKIVAGAVAAYAGGNAQTAINTAETAVNNNALPFFLVGAAWLADKLWTAYEVSQDLAAIRDGSKTVQQVALERGEDYVTGILIGNLGRYGVKAIKEGGKWVQDKVLPRKTVKPKQPPTLTVKTPSPPVVQNIKDLYGQTFESARFSHLGDRQDGKLAELLALDAINSRTNLNLRPLQNASNHGCDGCAVSIKGDVIYVLEVKSSQNGVGAVKRVTGDPEEKALKWSENKSIIEVSTENGELAGRIQKALHDGIRVEGIVVNVGIPAPGSRGRAQIKVQAWPKH